MVDIGQLTIELAEEYRRLTEAYDSVPSYLGRSDEITNAI